jgi:flagellin-like hook-associated protein FlgL
MSVDGFLYQQQQLAAQLLRSQQEISTQKSITVPSDDPLASARILQFAGSQQRQEQILTNLGMARDFMNHTDAALDDVAGLLDRAKELALGGMNSIALPAEREAAAIEIDSIVDTLVRVANTNYLGMYVFGGRAVDRPPVQRTLGGVEYTGDAQGLSARLSAEGDEEYTLTADEIFLMLSQGVRGADLSPAVTAGTRLDELDGAIGQGIRLGTLRIEEDGPAGAYSVDLAGATSLGRIIDLINAAAQGAGSATRVSLNGTRDGLLLTPGAPLRLSSADNGDMARDLGLVRDAPAAAPLIGADLQRRVTPTTLLADLLGGAGLDPGGTIVIRNGDHEAAVDLGSAVTVQDILQLLGQPGVGVRAEIDADGQRINLRNQVSGLSLTVQSGGGGSVGAALGVLSSTDVRVDGVFTALEELRRGLLDGDEQLMSRAASRLDELITVSSGVRGRLGARVRDLEMRIDQTQQAVDATAALRGDIEGVRLEEALIRFQAVQNALQASLLAGGRSLSQSLMDFLQ